MLGYLFNNSLDPIDQLQNYLFLGGSSAARDKEALQRTGITHILNVADDVECYYQDSFKYLHFQIEDGGEDETIVDCFEDATAFVRKARDSNGKVLVHCMMGINRSATVAMAVQMNIEGLTLEKAFRHTKKKRDRVSPFPGNRMKIAAWEWRTRGASTFPEWLSDELLDEVSQSLQGKGCESLSDST